MAGITGAIINAVSLIRNILCYNNKLNNKAKAILIILSVILSIKYNNLGIIGMLPVISTVTYILFMNIKSVRNFKILIIFTMIMWFIYDLTIKSYTAAFFDMLNIIANFITVFNINNRVLCQIVLVNNKFDK